MVRYQLSEIFTEKQEEHNYTEMTNSVRPGKYCP